MLYDKTTANRICILLVKEKASWKHFYNLLGHLAGIGIILYVFYVKSVFRAVSLYLFNCHMYLNVKLIYW